ncbi:MAG TPA: hypothetical protein VJB16_06660 [archaeon]|nr:hypothetical protein [archaeon]
MDHPQTPELFAIRLALQSRNQQAALLLLDAGRESPAAPACAPDGAGAVWPVELPASGCRGILAELPEAIATLKPPEPPFRRPKPPAPSELHKHACAPRPAPQGISAFLNRLKPKPVEYLDLTA